MTTTNMYILVDCTIPVDLYFLTSHQASATSMTEVCPRYDRFNMIDSESD